MRRINRLAIAALAAAIGFPVSTFAEKWNQSGTVDRVIAAAGTILSQRGAGRATPRDVGTSMVLRELEQLLRNRSVNRGTSQRPSESRAPQTRTRGTYSGSLIMPVAGVSPAELQDSFGDARSGGRSHMGIDIFAPRWTEALAVTSGSLSSVGSGARSGRSVWLVGDDGRAYFYAHLQDWADGVRDGVRVRAGQVIGYVGNSGNAASAATHLHFEVRDPSGRTVNPYYVLADARTADPPYRTASNGRGRTSYGSTSRASR